MDINDRPAARAVAANMKRLRRKNAWTQDELGAKLGGWSKATVSAAECSVSGSRQRHFTIDEVVQIAAVFGVGVQEMIDPIQPCAYCNDQPARGMKCLACGALDKTFAKLAEEDE